MSLARCIGYMALFVLAAVVLAACGDQTAPSDGPDGAVAAEGGADDAGAGGGSFDGPRADGACVPTTCAAKHATCGSLADGCGGTLDCGHCATGEMCGGGGTPNVCDGPCDHLAPDPSPAVNRTNIQHCLDALGHASLSPGVFKVNDAISVPTGAVLRGLGATRPTLQRVPGSAGNVLVALNGDNARVSSLSLDGNNAFPGSCCDSVVAIAGNNNTLENTQTFNNTVAPHGGPAGIYVICEACTGNVISNVESFNNFYGVIIRPNKPTGTRPPNTLDHSTIRDNKCDSITFIGYGVVTNSEIRNTGFNCENGPIPGGGVYTLHNSQGGVIRGNTIHDNCGNGLDLVESSNFDIQENHIYDPGNRFGGAYPYCSGTSVAFFTMSSSTLRHNVIENNDRPWNTPTPPSWIDWFRPRGGAPWSDLPGGASTVLAFLLAKDPGSTYDATGNIIDGNQMRASCGAGCMGVGYFSTRGTGLAGGTWSASTTNYFTANDPFGSNVGSTRCGANWYAASAACGQGSAAPCNTDDFQHTSDWLRTDNCKDY